MGWWWVNTNSSATSARCTVSEAGKALNWDVSWYETATRYTRYMAHPSDGLDRGAPGRGYYSSTTLSLPADGSGELGSNTRKKVSHIALVRKYLLALKHSPNPLSFWVSCTKCY